MKISKLVFIALASFAASCAPASSTAALVDDGTNNVIININSVDEAAISHSEFHEATDFGDVVGPLDQRRNLRRSRPRPTLSSCGGANNKNTGNKGNNNNNNQANVDVSASVSSSNLNADENAVVKLVNDERAKAGCKPLTVNAKLTAAARGHSSDMANKNFFSHTSPSGSTMSSRIKASGFTNFRQIAENIAAGQKTPAAVMNAWMNSAGHRANILNCGLKEIGVGVASNSNSRFKIYWTQDFGTSSSSSSSPPPAPPSSSPSSKTPVVTPTPSKKAPAPTPDTNTRAPPPSNGNNNGSGAGSAGVTQEENDVVKLVNVEREKAGCGPLSINAKLTAAARGHSSDMANRNFFDHDSPTGSTMSSRIKAAGYTNFRQIAENIAAGQQTPASVMNAWMNSSGHRANILNCGLKEIGVGVARKAGSSFGIYWTQDFGTQF